MFRIDALGGRAGFSPLSHHATACIDGISHSLRIQAQSGPIPLLNTKQFNLFNIPYPTQVRGRRKLSLRIEVVTSSLGFKVKGNVSFFIIFDLVWCIVSVVKRGVKHSSVTAWF